MNRSGTAFRHRMRCSLKKTCYKRFTLRKHPSKYKKEIKCPFCGTNKVHSCEDSRKRELKKQDTHTCHEYPFPHRKGSLPLCTFNPNRIAKIPPTDEELLAHETIIDTPRKAWTFGTDMPTPEDLPEAPF